MDQRDDQGKMLSQHDQEKTSITKPNLNKLILIGNSFQGYHENLKMRGKDKDESNAVLKLAPYLDEKKIKIYKAEENKCPDIGRALSETYFLSLQKLSRHLIKTSNRPPEFVGPDPELY